MVTVCVLLRWKRNCWSTSLLCLSWCQFHQHFYVQIFCTNVVSAAFSSYVLVLAKNSYKKCAPKMLMKLTPGKILWEEKWLVWIWFEEDDPQTQESLEEQNHCLKTDNKDVLDLLCRRFSMLNTFLFPLEDLDFRILLELSRRSAKVCSPSDSLEKSQKVFPFCLKFLV